MVNTLNIQVTFGSQHHIFECSRREFIPTICKFFNLQENDFDMFCDNGEERKKISVRDLEDIMSVELVRKTFSSINQQSCLDEYLEQGESSKDLTLVESIVCKLKENRSFTGAERKFLLDLLEKNTSFNSSFKPKPVSKSNCIDMKNKKIGVEMKNKKVQAHVINTTESFTQTDFIGVEGINEFFENNSQNESMSKRIKLMAASPEKNEKEISIIMAKSFRSRRHFIVSKQPPVKLIKENYPLLFFEAEVKNEIDRIFWPGQCDLFFNNVRKYASLILNEKPKHPISQLTQKILAHCHTEPQKIYAEDVGSILLLPAFFKETIGFIKLSDNDLDCDVYPYIKAEDYSMKQLFYDNLKCEIIVENIALCEPSNFKEAILCLLGSYYVFNIDYPENWYQTYGAMEKLYLQANDTHTLRNDTEQIIKQLKIKAGR